MRNERILGSVLGAVCAAGLVAIAACDSGGSTSPPAGDDAAAQGHADGAVDGAGSDGDANTTVTQDGGGDSASGDGGFDAQVPNEGGVQGIIPSGAVLEYHGSATRAGYYSDTALTPAAFTTLHRDTSFGPTITGPVTAQPLYVANGPGGKTVYIVATDQNHILAIDAANGTTVWDKSFGTPVPLAKLPCGNIDPYGVAGTPFVDLASRTVYFSAMSTPDNGTTIGYHIFAIALDDGSTRAGWPVDVESKVSGFASAGQGQRGGLALLGGVLYVPYGGHYGDCDPYHGWVIGVQVANPATGVKSWQTTGSRGGIWSVGGILSDGASVFAATGNTANTTDWTGGEAVLRFASGPTFSGSTADYFRPANWVMLDDADLDVGGATPAMLDVPGATPSRLLVAVGKDGNAYVLDRDNLGGMAGQLSTTAVATGEVTGAMTAYHTTMGYYVAVRAQGDSSGVGCSNGGNIIAIRISATNPPKASVAWCSNKAGLGTPTSSTADHGATAVVWAGASTLFGYDGDTGQSVFSGADTDTTEDFDHFATPIVVPGGVVLAGKSLFVFRP